MSAQQTMIVNPPLHVCWMKVVLENVSIPVKGRSVVPTQTVRFKITHLSADVLTSMLETQALPWAVLKLSVKLTMTVVKIKCVKWQTTGVSMHVHLSTVAKGHAQLSIILLNANASPDLSSL